MTNLAVPSPRTFTPGETEVGSYLNSLRDALNFLINPPILTATQASGQSIPNVTWTSLALDATSVDSYGMHSNSVNNTRAVAQVAGWYLVCGSVNWNPNSTGNRGIRLAKNGTAIVGSGAFRLPTGAGNTDGMGSSSLLAFLAVGDYVEVQAFQSSGGALNTVIGSDVDASMTVTWTHA